MKFFAGFVCLLIMPWLFAFGGNTADFSGTWIRDAGRSDAMAWVSRLFVAFDWLKLPRPAHVRHRRGYDAGVRRPRGAGRCVAAATHGADGCLAHQLRLPAMACLLFSGTQRLCECVQGVKVGLLK